MKNGIPKKYGVTNLSKIESYKQSIMQIDESNTSEQKQNIKYIAARLLIPLSARNKKLIETCGGK